MLMVHLIGLGGPSQVLNPAITFSSRRAAKAVGVLRVYHLQVH